MTRKKLYDWLNVYVSCCDSCVMLGKRTGSPQRLLAPRSRARLLDKIQRANVSQFSNGLQYVFAVDIGATNMKIGINPLHSGEGDLVIMATDAFVLPKPLQITPEMLNSVSSISGSAIRSMGASVRETRKPFIDHAAALSTLVNAGDFYNIEYDPQRFVTAIKRKMLIEGNGLFTRDSVDEWRYPRLSRGGYNTFFQEWAIGHGVKQLYRSIDVSVDGDLCRLELPYDALQQILVRCSIKSHRRLNRINPSRTVGIFAYPDFITHRELFTLYNDIFDTALHDMAFQRHVLIPESIASVYTLADMINEPCHFLVVDLGSQFTLSSAGAISINAGIKNVHLRRKLMIPSGQHAVAAALLKDACDEISIIDRNGKDLRAYRQDTRDILRSFAGTLIHGVFVNLQELLYHKIMAADALTEPFEFNICLGTEYRAKISFNMERLKTSLVALSRQLAKLLLTNAMLTPSTELPLKIFLTGKTIESDLFKQLYTDAIQNLVTGECQFLYTSRADSSIVKGCNLLARIMFGVDNSIDVRDPATSKHLICIVKELAKVTRNGTRDTAHCLVQPFAAERTGYHFITILVKAWRRRDGGHFLVEDNSQMIDAGVFITAVHLSAGDIVQHGIFDHGMLTLFINREEYIRSAYSDGVFISWQPQSFQELYARLGRVYEHASDPEALEGRNMFFELCKLAFPSDPQEAARDAASNTINWLSSLHNVLAYTTSVCCDHIVRFNDHVAAVLGDYTTHEMMTEFEKVARLPFSLLDTQGPECRLENVDSFEDMLRVSGDPDFGFLLNEDLD